LSPRAYWFVGRFITLSTIGFGDLLPGWDAMGTAPGNIKFGITFFYIMLGLAVLSMSFNLLLDEMTQKVALLMHRLGTSMQSNQLGYGAVVNIRMQA
jgi:hypothetical protein